MDKTPLSGSSPTYRINEPFVKAHLALWLVARGANDIVVSVAGSEVRPDQVRQILESAGYSYRAATRSRTTWTGTYTQSNTQIVVISHPGQDISAILPDGTTFVAECKGQAASAGEKSGIDLTSLYHSVHLHFDRALAGLRAQLRDAVESRRLRILNALFQGA